MKREKPSGNKITKNNPPIISPIECGNKLKHALNKFVDSDFIAVDTEFIREKTYYPQLCLVQISNAQSSMIIDPLSTQIEMKPLWDLLCNPNVTKVFHAGGQDMEIFLNHIGKLPSPVFDTQIAAMACGLGDQVGYDKLVKEMIGNDIDKTSRFTDWSKRPLTNRQLQYALDDVIFLAKLYPILRAKLENNERTHWLDDEYAKFCDESTYVTKPEEAWRKLKIRKMSSPTLLRLIKLAAWRELEAQRRDLPRNRIIRDETLIDLAGSNPQNSQDFDNIKNFPGGKKGKMITPIRKVLQETAVSSEKTSTKIGSYDTKTKPPQAIVELLRVLLKHVTDEKKIAPKLIAKSGDLEMLALDDDANIPALNGWRREIFGDLAIALKKGEISLTVRRNRLSIIKVHS